MASSNSSLNIKKGTVVKMSKSHQSPLQILLQMGFPKHRAEKALAATGNYSAELATRWLLSHVNDPFLDDNSPREYILYACPRGRFLSRLKEFWQRSLELFGWNGAHNYIPHITLVSFFKTPDEDVPHLIESLESVMEKDGAVLNEPLKLETYTSPNFMGFFVAEEHADYLKRIAMRFVREVSNAIVSDTYEHFDALTACFPWCTTTTARCIPRGSRSISLEPHVKSLHLTLGYQFPNSQYNDLKTLVDELDSNESGEWELRLYSRDQRQNDKQVYRVVREYTPSESDDLELKFGDILYVNLEALNSSTDGWLEGTSWSTGCSGFFPESYTERAPESDAWTLHKNIPLNNLEEMTTANITSSQVFGLETIQEFMKDKYITDLKNVTPSSVQTNNSERELYLMRHGERVDFVFGKWIPHSFDETDNYIRKDLNMPSSLPVRKSGPESYREDTPITTVGQFQARTIGENFREKNIEIHHVFCSPSFRCLQTLHSFLQGINKSELKIKIDPTLFEWTAWYGNSQPNWMSKDEMLSAGFNIDTEYTPFMNEIEVKDPKETCEGYYRRSAAFTGHVLNSYPTGNVLFVGHASTLDTCSRNLLHKGHREFEEMFKVAKEIPYCAFVKLSFDGKDWKLDEPPCAPLTHCTNNRFDWKILQTE